MKTTSLVFPLAGCIVLMLCAVGLSIAFGGPSQPKPMASINAPFRSVDFSDMPSVSRFAARDGARLAYRYYDSPIQPPHGSVVLIHGSSASSNSMHPMAKALSRAGFAVYALDMRGHGESGTKGQIAYIGQLEDDVEDFMKVVTPNGKRTLVGFSSGGGFVLRFAGSNRQQMFDNYLLLSPFLHQDATTSRPNSDGWVSVGIPRVITLMMLNRIGITMFNNLPVVAFALNEEAQKLLTPRYSFALASNFRPHSDFRADIRSATQPMEVMAGENDELFHAEMFAEVFKEAGNPLPATIIPGVGHIRLTLNEDALRYIVAAVERLDAKSDGIARSKPHDAVPR